MPFNHNTRISSYTLLESKIQCYHGTLTVGEGASLFVCLAGLQFYGFGFSSFSTYLNTYKQHIFLLGQNSIQLNGDQLYSDTPPCGECSFVLLSVTRQSNKKQPIFLQVAPKVITIVFTIYNSYVSQNYPIRCQILGILYKKFFHQDLKNSPIRSHWCYSTFVSYYRRAKN